MPDHDDDVEFLIRNYRRLTPAGHSLLRRLAVERAKALRAEFLRGLWRKFLFWRQRRTALAQLGALDDAALKDIGLHRSGIEDAVLNGPARTTPGQGRTFPEKPHLCLHRTSAADLQFLRARGTVG